MDPANSGRGCRKTLCFPKHCVRFEVLTLKGNWRTTLSALHTSTEAAVSRSHSGLILHVSAVSGMVSRGVRGEWSEVEYMK